MKKSTDQLLNEIRKVYSIDDYIKYNTEECFNITVDEYLRKLLDKKGLKINKIGNSTNLGDYIYKIFKGIRKGSRDIYIAIGIAMGIEENEMQMLLRLAKYMPLDPRDIRDSVFLYAVSKKLSIIDTNIILYELNKETLGICEKV